MRPTPPHLSFTMVAVVLAAAACRDAGTDGVARADGGGGTATAPDVGAAAANAPSPGPELGEPGARATIRDAAGKLVGEAAFYETPSAGVLIRLDLTDAEPGSHAFHLHSIASCTPDLMAAGGHFNAGGGRHGILSTEGRHTGDLPNVHVPSSRALVVDVLVPGATLEEGSPGTLFDDDGSAVMLHRGPDPYTSPPRGSDGERWACGAIVR